MVTISSSSARYLHSLLEHFSDQRIASSDNHFAVTEKQSSFSKETFTSAHQKS